MQRPSVITLASVPIQTQTTTTIDRVHERQLARDVGSRSGRRKLTGLWHMVPLLLGQRDECEQAAGHREHNAKEMRTAAHDCTSETSPLLSANFSVGTSIF